MKDIIELICEGQAKNRNTTTLILSPDKYTEFIAWDCKNSCMYYPDFVNPPPIMGLKVILKKGENILEVI